MEDDDESFFQTQRTMPVRGMSGSTAARRVKGPCSVPSVNAEALLSDLRPGD